MMKALKITGLAALALIITVVLAITSILIGVLLVTITASGIIVLTIIGIITPKEKLKKITNAIDTAIEDEN